MSPAFDQLLSRLVDSKVDFVVVGGLALAVAGVVRGTKDVDIVVDPDPENLQRLAGLAVVLNGHVQSADTLVSSEFGIRGLLGGGDQVAIETELGRLDVVQGLDGVPPYPELRSRATEAEILGVEVPVCGVADLKTMKRAAGRTRDLADLEDLDTAADSPPA